MIRSPPLRFLAVALGCWIGLRAAALLPGGWEVVADASDHSAPPAAVLDSPAPPDPTALIAPTLPTALIAPTTRVACPMPDRPPYTLL